MQPTLVILIAAMSMPAVQYLEKTNWKDNCDVTYKLRQREHPSVVCTSLEILFDVYYWTVVQRAWSAKQHNPSEIIWHMVHFMNTLSNTKSSCVLQEKSAHCICLNTCCLLFSQTPSHTRGFLGTLQGMAVWYKDLSVSSGMCMTIYLTGRNTNSTYALGPPLPISLSTVQLEDAWLYLQYTKYAEHGNYLSTFSFFHYISYGVQR